MTSGVSQGTVLGPILFLVNINYLPERVRHSSVCLFADDCILLMDIHTEDDCQKLQQGINRVAGWETDWLMKFNQTKCEKMTIPVKRSPIVPEYTFHGHVLAITTKAKYLGIIIQSDLKWNTHISNITKKSNQMVGLLRRDFRVEKTSLKGMAYQSLVKPQIEYAAVVWDPHTLALTRQVEMIRCRAARYVII